MSCFAVRYCEKIEEDSYVVNLSPLENCKVIGGFRFHAFVLAETRNASMPVTIISSEE